MFYAMDLQDTTLHVFEDKEEREELVTEYNFFVPIDSKKARCFIERECENCTFLDAETRHAMKTYDLLLELIEMDPYDGPSNDECILLTHITLHW